MLGLALASGDRFWLLFIPALVNFYLALLFASSRRDEMSIVERGARMLQPYLPDFTRSYCHVLSGCWAAFFLVFAILIAWAALSREVASWRFFATTLYFGLITAISAVEFVHRKIWFRNYGIGPFDRFLQRLFPCEATERGLRSKAYMNHMHETLYGRSRFD